MELQAKDFEKMQYNVYAINTDVLTAFPSLKKYPEFEVELVSFDKDKVLKYIFLMYQKNTPLIREMDLGRRKSLALKLAGFKMNGGAYPENITRMAECKNGQVNKIIIRFIRIQNDLKFSTLMSLYESYYNTLSLIMSKEISNKDDDALIDAEKKQKLSTGIKKTLEQIEELSMEVFTGDEKLVYVADSIIQDEIIHTNYAEKFAQELVDNQGKFKE